jgi:hypothetical protein
MRHRLSAVIAAWLALTGTALADQGGVSFWLPGAFGSLTATPLQPGWSFASFYLHASVEAGGNVSASRTINFPNRTATLNANLNANLKARMDAVAFSPTYVFSHPVLGGQFAVTLLEIVGRQKATIDATATGALGPIGFATQRSVSDSLTGASDFYIQPTLRWNNGVHNYMVYGMMNIPVGAYDSTRMVNIGMGHWAIDGGAGYTYFNPQTGYEFSVVTGLTYNFENPDLDYQNGIDWHVDWGASYFVSKQVHIGLVGYLYQQISDDSGSGATLGGFRSRVAGIGPQIGYLFPIGDKQGYLNLKGYKEFAAENRPEGWNMWLSFVISPEAPKPGHPLPRTIVAK